MIQEQTMRSGRPRMAEISNNKNNSNTNSNSSSKNNSNTLQLFHSLDDNNNIPLTVTMITNNSNSNTKNIINNNNNDSIINTNSNNNNNNNNNSKITISLPENILDSLHKSEHFPTNRNRWNTNEEIAALLISIDQHEKWLSEEVQLRPKSGSMLLYSRKHVHYRRDGYCWKKRKDGKTTREDHMKLKVQGIECIYGCYVHSAILPTFHRRCYWLLQNPNIVLVHYLNVPTNDDNKTISRTLNSLPDTRKEWTREDLIQELKPMFYSIINETDNEYGNNNDNNDELEQSTLDMIESIIQQLLFKQRERCIKSPEDLTTTATTIMPTNNLNNGTNNNNNSNNTNEFISIRSITNNNNTSISPSLNFKNSNIRAHQIFTSLSSGQIVEAANSNNKKLFNVSENNIKRNSTNNNTIINNNNDIVDINGNSLILQQQTTNNTLQVLQLTNAGTAAGTRLCQLNTSGDHSNNHHHHHEIIKPPNSLGNGCRLTTATGQQQQQTTSPIITLNMSQIQSSFIILNNNNDNNNNNNDSNGGNAAHTSNSNNNQPQNSFNQNKNNQNGNGSNTNTVTITDPQAVSSILSFVTYQKQQNQRIQKQRHHRTGSIQEDFLDQLQYQQQSNCLLTAKSSSTSLSPSSQCSPTSSSSSSSSSIAFKVPINIGINTESLSSSSSLSSISPTSSSTTTTLFATTLVTETQTKNSVMTPILTTTATKTGSVMVPNNNSNNSNNCNNHVSSNKNNDNDDDDVDDEMAQVLAVNEIEMDTLNNLGSRNFNLDDEESMLICSSASSPERSIINNHNLNFVNSLTSNNNNNQNNHHDHYLNHHLKSENDDTNFDAFDTMYDDRGAGLIHSSGYVSNRHRTNNPFISNNIVNQHSLHSSLIHGRNQINVNESSSHNNNNNNSNINIKNECLMNVSTNSVGTFDTHQEMDFMDHEDISTSDDILFNLETFDMFGEFDHLDQESNNTGNVLDDDGNLNANQVNDTIKTEIIDDNSCQQATNNNDNDNMAINIDNEEQQSRLDNNNNDNNNDKNNGTTIPIIRPSLNDYDRQSCIMKNSRHQLSTVFIKNEIDSDKDDDVDDDNIPTSVREYWAKQSEITTTTDNIDETIKTTSNKKTEPGGQVNFSTIISEKKRTPTNETFLEDPKTTNITTMIIGSSGNDNGGSIAGTSTTSIDVTVDENGNLSITKNNRRTSGVALQQKHPHQIQKNISTMSQNHPLLKRQLSTANLLMVDNNTNDNNSTNNGLNGSTHQHYHQQHKNVDHTEESRRVYYSSVSNNTASSSSSSSSVFSVDSTVTSATSTFDVNHNDKNINSHRKNSLKGSADTAVATITSNTNNNIINITDYSPEWCYTDGGIKVLVAGPWYESNDGGGNRKNRYSILFDNIPVPTELVQNGLLRCFSPKHEIGFVTLNVSCNDVIISNSVIFEYRMSNSTNNNTGTINNNNSSTGTFHNSSPIPPPSSSSTSSSPSSFYLTINENSLSINDPNQQQQQSMINRI